MANDQHMCKVEFKTYNLEFKFEFENPDSSSIASVLSGGLTRVIPETVVQPPKPPSRPHANADASSTNISNNNNNNKKKNKNEKANQRNIKSKEEPPLTASTVITSIYRQNYIAAKTVSNINLPNKKRVSSLPAVSSHTVTKTTPNNNQIQR
jgi:hypothetical protein